MMPSTVTVSTTRARPAADAAARPPANTPAAISALLRMCASSVLRLAAAAIEPAQHLLGLGGRGVQRQRALHLASRGARVLELQVRFGERDARGGAVSAPDRNLERVDRFAETPGA